MLAAWTDYLFLWQVPLIVAYLAAWVFGGAAVLRWALRRQGADRRLRYDRCVLVCFLSGLAGTFGAGVIYLAASGLEQRFGLALTVPGALLALAAGAALSYLVLFAMFGLSPRRTVRAWGWTVAAMAVLGLLIALPAGKVSYDRRQRDLVRMRCQERLLTIHQALLARYGFADGPDDLGTLLEADLIKPGMLRCPACPDLPRGYLYLAAPTLPRERPSLEIRAADLRANHPGFRNVLFVNGALQTYGEAEFQDLLRRPENADFARVVRSAEGR